MSKALTSTDHTNQGKNNPLQWIGLAGIITYTLLLVLPQAIYNPATGTDEAWYGSITLEMIRRGSFFTSWYNYEIFYDKMPLIYWLQMISFELLGRTDFALRLPTVLFSIGLVSLVYSFFVKRVGIISALLACIMILSYQDMVRFMAKGQLDIPLAFAMTLTIFCMCKALVDKGCYLFLVGPCLALAFWMKTFNMAQVCACIFVMWLFSGQWKLIFNWRVWAGFATGVLLVFIYLLEQRMALGEGYFQQWWWYTLVLYLTNSEHHDTKTYTFYFEYLFSRHIVFVVTTCLAILYALPAWYSLRKRIKASLATPNDESSQRTEDLKILRTRQHLIVAGLSWTIFIPLPYVITQATNYWYLVPMSVGPALIWGQMLLGSGWKLYIRGLALLLFAIWSAVFIATWYFPSAPKEYELKAMREMSAGFIEKTQHQGELVILRYPEPWPHDRKIIPDLPLVAWYFEIKITQHPNRKALQKLLNQHGMLYLMGTEELIQHYLNEIDHDGSAEEFMSSRHVSVYLVKKQNPDS